MSKIFPQYSANVTYEDAKEIKTFRAKLKVFFFTTLYFAAHIYINYSSVQRILHAGEHS